jgi:2-amino-4-hydroxy-6-hydroxymethyldihydropteridine diphosphokinase
MYRKKNIVLLLGSNIGDRTKNLKTAIVQIERNIGSIDKFSMTYNTKAVGFRGNDFLNQIIVMNIDISPYVLLNKLQKIEINMGRTKKTINKNYASRIIDIDILLYDDWVISSPNLQIPHHQILSRQFVGNILKDTIPHHYHPLLSKQMQTLFNESNQKNKILNLSK